MSTALPTGTLDERLEPVKATRVYLRQSKEQEHQRESVPTQRAECERLAYSIGGWAGTVAGRHRNSPTSA